MFTIIKFISFSIVVSDLELLFETKQFTKVNQLLDVNPSLVLLRDEVNNTLLHHASIHGADMNYVKRLLDAGCELKERNKNGTMPIHYAVMGNCLHLLKWFIHQDATLVNAVSDHDVTPLHYGAINNNKDVVEFLLQQPAIDVNVKDHHGGKMADEMWHVNDEIKEMIRRRRNGTS